MSRAQWPYVAGNHCTGRHGVPSSGEATSLQGPLGWCVPLCPAHHLCHLLCSPEGLSQPALIFPEGGTVILQEMAVVGVVVSSGRRGYAVVKEDVCVCVRKVVSVP